MAAPAFGNIRRFFSGYLFKEMHHLNVMHALAAGLPWYVPGTDLEPIQAALVQAVFGFDRVSFMADTPLAMPYDDLVAHLRHCIDSGLMIRLGDQPLQLNNLPEPLCHPVTIHLAGEADTAVLCSMADPGAGHERWILRWRRLHPNSGAMQLFLFDLTADRVYLTPSLARTTAFADLLADLTAVVSLQALYEPGLRLDRFKAMAAAAVNLT